MALSRQLYPYLYHDGYIYSFKMFNNNAPNDIQQEVEIIDRKYDIVFSKTNTQVESTNIFNIINESRFEESKYSKHPTTNYFCSIRTNDFINVKQNGTDLERPDLVLLKEYKSTICNGKGNLFVKTNFRRTLLVSRYTLYDIIKANGINRTIQYFASFVLPSTPFTYL